MTAWSPNRARPIVRAVRDTEQETKGIGVAPFAGVTGGNSPHYTNQSTKTKIDRVLANIFSQVPARLKIRTVAHITGDRK